SVPVGWNAAALTSASRKYTNRGRETLNSVPAPPRVPPGVPVVTSVTAGVMVLAPAGPPRTEPAHPAGVLVVMLFSWQLGSLKYPPTPLAAPVLSRPKNRFSRPPDIGSIALGALVVPCAAIAVGSFSSPVTTQPPGAERPMSARNVFRVPDPACGMIGTIRAL